MCPPMHNVSVRIILHERAMAFRALLLAPCNTMLAQLGFVVCGVAVMMTLHLLTRWVSCSCLRR
jgi:hypothetical protein